MTEEQLEKAIQTHARRRKVFMDEGLCEEQAFDLAEKMFERDKDPYDDRRVCFECKNYVNRHCIAYTDKFNRATMQLRFVLQRCPKFILKGKKPLTDEEKNQIDASNQHQERDE
jgi:queuine/archaeosine tRNA-ribosyltransferase